MQSYISTSTAALLTGEDRRRVFEKITDGVYETRKQSGGRGGNGGESYQIAVSSLPQEAQILYYAQCDNAAGGLGQRQRRGAALPQRPEEWRQKDGRRKDGPYGPGM